MDLIVLQNSSTSNIVADTLKFIVSVIAPVISGYIGVRYGLKQIKLQKQINLIEKQLDQFYSPVIGLHKEIKAKSEFRFKINELSTDAWKENARNIGRNGNAPEVVSMHKEIEYNNRQLKEEFIPAYNKMLDIFKENYWLAEPETKEFYTELVEYVEVWNRYLKDGLPVGVLDKINHDEGKLKPFYEELENRTKFLRDKILKMK